MMPSLFRWLSMILCGITAGLACSLISAFPPINDAADAWIAATREFKELPVIVSILALAIAYSFGRGRWEGFLGTRFFFAYPPLWVAVPAGLLVTAWRFDQDILAHIWVPLLLGALAFVSFAIHRQESFGFATACNGGCGAERSDQQSAKKLSDFGSLLKWLVDDCEVNTPDMDLFGHNDIAMRIARRLTDKSGDDAPSIAVIGKLGSGKSTIAKLVLYHLKRNESTVRMVRISAWAYDSPEAAARGILNQLITELALHVNVIGLTGLPQQYLTTVEATGGFWQGVTRLLAGRREPQEILRKIEDILLATDMRLVLWIEDLERFAGDVPERSSAPTHDLRLQPICALLHLLDRCKRLSVIAADTSLRSRFDLDKIARFLEDLPRMDPDDVASVIKTFREGCLTVFQHDKIDPVPAKIRNQFKFPDDMTRRLARYVHADRNPNAPDAIQMLCSTPRVLKCVLRATFDVWKKLGGEIDFDDVLAMSAVRIADPDTFALVAEKISAFQHGFGKTGHHQDRTKNPIYLEFCEKIRNEGDDSDRSCAVEALLRYVFPEIPTENVSHDYGLHYVHRPQGLAVDRHVNYWSRYTSIPIVPLDSSDQSMLLAIKTWKSGDKSWLANAIQDENKSEHIESFVGQFTPDELIRLLLEVSESLQTQGAEDWGEHYDAPGVIPIWRMMQRKNPSEEHLTLTLSKLLGELTAIHLPLSYSLFYRLSGSTREHSQELIDRDQRKELRDVIRQRINETFISGHPKSLVHALQRGSSWLLFHISRETSDDPDNAPLAYWKDFPDVVLSAARIDPIRVLPCIVPFVAKGEMTSRLVQIDGEQERVSANEATFMPDVAKRLFGQDFEEFTTLFAANPAPEWIEVQGASHYDAVHTACREIVDSRRATDGGGSGTSADA